MSDFINEQPESHPRMGLGPFPPELDRLNWPAVLWTGLWMLVQGAWWWFGGLLLVRLAGVTLYWLVSRSGAGQSVLFALSVALTLGTYAYVTIFALRANRFVWRSREKRLATGPLLPGQHQERVTDYLKSQASWTKWGIVFLAVSNAYSLWQVRASSGLWRSAFFVALELAFFGCLWVFDRVSSGRRAKVVSDSV